MKFYDTNALIELQEKIFDEYFCISSESLYELEEIKSSGKKDENTKYLTRQVSHMLLDNKDKYKVIHVDDLILSIVDEYNIPSTSDNLICACAKSIAKGGVDIEFVSYDVLCNLTARDIFGLNVSENINAVDLGDYKGFRTVCCTDDELSSVYSKDNCDNLFNCLINEYIIIENESNEFCDVLRWTGEKYASIWNKNIKTLAFGDKIKAKDVYQRMVIDSIINNQLTCISGHAGSGKTLLSLMTIMHLIETGKYDRVVIMFNPCTVRGAKELGYYGGTVLEKSLAQSIGHILTSKFGERFAVDNYIAQGKIKLLPMADCRGCEVTDTEILYITEAENTTADLMKICLSRVSTGAKVVIEGDFDQVDGKSFESNNGMKRAIDVLKGEKEFGYVQLQNVWRSRIAELVDKF
jgi:PhoH-like ATPase